MLRIRRILRDYDNAGSLNSLIALWGFVDDSTFLTKAGHVGVVYRLAGVDFECLDQAQRRDVVHRYEAALRGLDESCRIYQYLCKRRMPAIAPAACRQRVAHEAVHRRATYLNGRRDELFQLDLHLVLVYEGLRFHAPSGRRLRSLWSDPRAAVRDWLSPSATLALVEADLERAIGQLHQKAAAFQVQLADSIHPTRLTKADAFQFLRRLVNYTPHIADGAALQYDTHLDYFVTDSALDCHRDHLDLGAAHVKVLTMKEPPSATFPQVLEELYTLPGEFIACLEWCRVPNDRMRRTLQLRRRHFFNKRVSMVNYVSPDTRPEEMLVDESANATVRQLGDALTEMEVNGHFFGDCSLALVLFNEDARLLERATAEATKVMAAHDGTFIDETYNLLNAWLSIVPGNSAHNLRRLPILETNYADLSFLFTLDTGQVRSTHLNAEALAVFETQHQTPYHFNLHVDDVGHILAIIVLTGRPEPPARPAAGPVNQALAPSPDRLRDYQDRLRVLDERGRQQALVDPADPRAPLLYEDAGTAAVDPLADEKKRRDYESLFASNVVVSRRPDGERPSLPTATASTARGARGLDAQPPAPPSLDEIAEAVMRATARSVPPPAPQPTATAATSQGRGAAGDARPRPAFTDPIQAAGPLHRLLEGTFIDAVLTNRLDGTSAAPVNCLVTNPVFSHSGQHILIPGGARVLGETKPVQSLGDATGQATAQVMSRFLNRLPTITIREGHRVKVYLTIEITDSVAQMGGHQVALVRGYSGRLQAAVNALERDVVSTAPGYHETTAVLDKIAAGQLLAGRQDMAANQLLSHVLEQLLVRSKRQRDSEAAVMNMRLVGLRDGRAASESVVRGAAHDLRAWRQP